MDYSQQMLARSEHNLMVSSLPTVKEQNYTTSENKNGNPVKWLQAVFMTLLHLVTR